MRSPRSSTNETIPRDYFVTVYQSITRYSQYCSHLKLEKTKIKKKYIQKLYICTLPI